VTQLCPIPNSFLRTEELYLRDIVGACNSIETFIAGLSKESVLENDLVLSAVIRKLEFIGEACARLPISLREEHPEIDWKAVIGFRNIPAHQYFSCDLEIIWRAASGRIGSLKGQIQDILNTRFPRPRK
jgi:uncharacterized protein with HEPN domain